MNPARIVAGGSAGSVAALVAVYVAGRLGVRLTGDDGAVCASAATATAAFVAHNGVVGIARMVWRGSTRPAPSSPTQGGPSV